MSHRSPPLRLIAMAGLPGSGKSTLATALASALGALVFDKDRLRDSLFAPGHVAYTRAQDDLCVALLHRAVEWTAATSFAPAVILDGRTHLRRYQVDELDQLARRAELELHIVLCVCSDDTARTRLAGPHVAANRTFALRRQLALEAEPIELPHFVARTDAVGLEELVRACLVYLNAPA